MNRKHSFPARCLALLLALVMILSNANLGFVLNAQAATVSESLFELIAASDCGTEELNAILAYADALAGLNDETVTYETAPEAADATLRQGVLAVEPVNGWVPYTYTVGGATKTFDGTYSVNVGEDTTEATVVYKYDLEDTKVAESLDLAAKLAAEAHYQAVAMEKISKNSDTMTGLKALDTVMIEEDLMWIVEDLTVEQAELDQIDFNENGIVYDDEDKIAAEAALEVVKDEYRAVFTALLDRFVDESDRYYKIEKNGRPAYRNQLRASAIMQEYNRIGLSDFYLNSEDIITEMDQLADMLYKLLGEYDAETGTYANAAVIDTMFSEAGYPAITNVQFTKLAKVMREGADNMSVYTSYKTEIDTSVDSETLSALCKALVACGEVANYSTDLYLIADDLEPVLDDSWRYVKVTLGETGIPCNIKFATDSVLTQDDVADILTKIALDARHYDVDTTAVEALVGTVMSENVEITCAAEVKVYTQNVVDAEGNVVATIEVSGDATTITLPVEDGHTTTYKIGENVYVVSYDDEKATVVEVAIDAVAAGELVIEVIDDVDHYKDNLEALKEDLNNKIGREAVVLTVNDEGRYEAMDVTISMKELTAFAETFVMSGMSPVALSNSPFIVDDNGTPAINMQALIDAILNDDTFSSEKMIAMGRGEEKNLVTTTIQVPGYDMAFTLNLTTMPEKMATVSKGLNAVKDFFWFESNEGVLDVNVDLPEKVYEAYLTAAIGTGYIDDDNVELSNKVAMEFVADYMEQLADMDFTAQTITNTLKAAGIDKDVSAYDAYLQMVKTLVNYSGFTYTINENNVDFVISGDKDHISMIMDLLGLDAKDLETGLKFVSYEPITGEAFVNLVNKVPSYEALVIEPGKINDAGIRAKLNTIDYTENLVAKAPTTGKVAAVMLLDDVNGNLNFGGNVILDLNGKTVNGSINVNGKVVIVDSNLSTYAGGKVTGTVYANGGAILGGTFGGDVSAFLRDGYYQDNGSVRNAMYYVEGSNGNYTYVLNADFYQLCDGYLPSVEALAAEIATDVALNAYPAAGMAYNGKTMYALNLESILSSYLGNGVGGAADALLTDLTAFVNVEGINALANDIIDDLCDFEALANSLNNNELIGRQYKFTSYPAVVEFVHDKSADVLDVSFVANTSFAKGFSIGLKVEGENDYYEYGKKLLTAMADIVTIDAQVALNQPTYNAATNTVSVSGNGTAAMVVDFTKDIDYTKGMAIILAYGNPDRAEELMNAKNCVAELNKIFATMTVEEVFTALKVMNRNVSMAEMAEAVGYKYDAAEIAELEKIYHILLCGMGKVLEKFDVTGNDTLLSAFADGEGSYTISVTDKEVDATVKGFTGVATLEYAELSLTIKLAEKCDKLIGDVDYDGDVDASDAAWILKYDAMFDNIDMHWCVADVDADNDVDASDAAWVLKYDALMCKYEDFPAVNP